MERENETFMGISKVAEFSFSGPLLQTQCPVCLSQEKKQQWKKNLKKQQADAGVTGAPLKLSHVLPMMATTSASMCPWDILSKPAWRKKKRLLA